MKREGAVFPHDDVPELARGGSAADFQSVSGADVAERSRPFSEWYDARLASDLWPYNKATASAPGAKSIQVEETGRTSSGVNLASQDYLSLADHPAVIDVALEAAKAYGVHSSGSAILMGNTPYSRKLEGRIGEILNYEHVLLYPTGWAAGYGVLRGLVRGQDHIVLDGLAHNCLQEGARAATKSCHVLPHLSLKAAERTLRRLRKDDTTNAIFVVTEGLFSMDSDTPDLAALHELCNEQSAFLVVDVAHDFGILGPTGRTALEEFNLLGLADIVIGAFSKTFASNGGFACVRNEKILKYLRVYSPSYLFSNALSPIQAAVILRSIEIVFSTDGDKRRKKLFRNITALRDGLEAGGLEVVGRPSPIIPVKLGDEFVVRIANYLCSERGVLTNVAEYPVVPRGQARFRLQAQSAHTTKQMAASAEAIVASALDARISIAARKQVVGENPTRRQVLPSCSATIKLRGQRQSG